MERNKEKIRLVVDTNILLSALLKDKTFTAKLLKSESMDEKDTPFLALALQLNCAVWSNDKHFKQQGVADAYTTEEVAGRD